MLPFILPFAPIFVAVMLILTAAIVYDSRRLSALPSGIRLALVLALAVAALAGVGLIVAIAPAGRRLVAAALLFSIATFALGWRWRSLRKLLIDAWLDHGLQAWFGLVFVAWCISYLQPLQPAQLHDGPYVFKDWVLPVKLQVLANDLPADNALPAVATEYMARGIGFADARPLMPGQDVANRPLLAALAALPFRALLGPNVAPPDGVPRFNYVGVNWPNGVRLMSDDAYRVYLAVGITLNALVVVGALALARAMDARLSAILVVAFLVLSPYVVLHTFFTWPKNLAAFLLLTAATLLITRRGAQQTGRLLAAAGGLVGMAYWAHPYALGFLFAMTLVLPLTLLRASPSRTLVFTAAAVALIAPWPLWARFWIGSESDLIQQNFLANVDRLQWVWVRVYNAFVTLAPTALDSYPLVRGHAIRVHLINLTSIVGPLWLTLPSVAVWACHAGYATIVSTALVAGLALIAVFSIPAAPLMHGWQAAGIMLLVTALVWLNRHASQRAIVAVALGQLSLSALVFGAWLLPLVRG